MRKIAAILLGLAIAFAIPFALAEGNPFVIPDEDRDFSSVIGVQESIQIEIGGNSLQLAFDNSSEYSSIEGGTVQASFYAYADNSDYLYELYMIFPDNVESGSTVTPDYAVQYDPDCSVVLIASTEEYEQYYFAGQLDGEPFPDDSGYAIRFDSVVSSGEARTYTGTLSASLVEIDIESNQALGSFDIESAPFSFTMPLNGSAPDAPSATPAPGIDFSLPAPETTRKVYKV